MNTPPVINPGELNSVLEIFNSIENPWDLTENSVILSSLADDLKNKILVKLSKSSFNKILDTINSINATIITCHDMDYPKNLKLIKNYPIMLFVRGDTSLLSRNNMLAVIGARNASSYSLSMTVKFILEAIKDNHNILTGTAEGVDRKVIETAIENTYPCVSVIASGIDRISPKASEEVLDKLVDSGGCYFTEFPPGVVSYKSNYDIRARVIASLCSSVLIIQANANSGTLLVASEAKKQHKPVYCVPYYYDDKTYEGSHRLMRANSARLVNKFEDIISHKRKLV